MCIQWYSSKSDNFNVYNGVKQGAIISSIFFCVYVDGLLNRLKTANLGCNIESFYTGSTAYADDLTFLALTAEARRSVSF